MSAFVVSKKHIDVLVAAGQRFAGRMWSAQSDIFRSDPDKAGRMLWSECVKSVEYRYPSDGPKDLPGPCDFDASTDIDRYRFHPSAEVYQLPLAAILKAIDCYEYQSCEHPTWKDSTAYRFCESLRSAVVSALPGYNEAPWGY